MLEETQDNMTMYGIGPGSLSERLGITREEAEDLLDDFYSTFTHVAEWKRAEIDKLYCYGYVTSLLGRRRSPILVQPPPKVIAKPNTPEYEKQKLMEDLWKLEWDFACKKSGFDPDSVEDTEVWGRAQRQTINFEVQGSVAELVNYGLWRIVRAGFRLLAQIHDEVIVEVPDTEEDRERVSSLIKEVYNITVKGVQFVADVNFGYSWAEAK